MWGRMHICNEKKSSKISLKKHLGQSETFITVRLGKRLVILFPEQQYFLQTARICYWFPRGITSDSNRDCICGQELSPSTRTLRHLQLAAIAYQEGRLFVCDNSTEWQMEMLTEARRGRQRERGWGWLRVWLMETQSRWQMIQSEIESAL